MFSISNMTLKNRKSIYRASSVKDRSVINSIRNQSYILCVKYDKLHESRKRQERDLVRQNEEHFTYTTSWSSEEIFVAQIANVKNRDLNKKYKKLIIGKMSSRY